jgi:hypothetical protein
MKNVAWWFLCCCTEKISCTLSILATLPASSVVKVRSTTDELLWQVTGACKWNAAFNRNVEIVHSGVLCNHDT